MKYLLGLVLALLLLVPLANADIFPISGTASPDIDLILTGTIR